MKPMRWSLALLAFTLPLTLAAADSAIPEKADTPYLLHGSQMIETEPGTAVDESTEKEGRYAVSGATSSVRTPFASPQFLLRIDKIEPRDLELYRFEPVGDRREIFLRKKKKILVEPYRMSVLDHEEDGVVQLRVNDGLPDGEYCLTPRGADTVFCFTVY